MSALILGVGAPVFDHVFGRSEIGYRGTGYIGGSSANVLVNCAAHVSTRFVGTIGVDSLSDRFLSELKDSGVVPDVGIRAGGRAFQLFQTPVDAARSIFPEVRADESAHAFSGTCPVCGARPNGRVKSNLVTTPRPQDVAAVAQAPARTVVFLDRVNKVTETVAKLASSQGQLVVLDIGRTDQLRFVPVARLMTLLSHVTVLFASTSTLDSIERRSGRGRQNLLKGGAVVELRGPQGFDVHTTMGSPVSEHVAPRAAVLAIDDAGAGDALISGVCQSLAIEGGLSQRALDSGLATGLSRVEAVLRARGALGHLRPLVQAVEPARANAHLEADCPFAGLVDIETPKSDAGETRTKVQVLASERSRSQINVSRMLARVLFAAEGGDTANGIFALLRSNTQPLVVLGTGGSTAAAEFIADATRRTFHRAAFAMKPREFLVADLRHVDLLGVSYSGKSADVLRALEFDADHGGRPQLLTGAAPNKFAEEDRRIRVLSYGGKGRTAERGFLSFAGTVAPCVATANALLGDIGLGKLQDVVSSRSGEWRGLGSAIADELLSDSTSVLHVLYAGEFRSAAVDLESKMIESGLGTVVLHELKDFTHGRFMSIDPQVALRPAVVLTLTSTNAGEYAEALGRALSDLEIPKFELEVDAPPVQDSLESLFAVQYLFVALAAAYGLDPSRPKHLEQKFIKLYRHKKNPAL